MILKNRLDFINEVRRFLEIKANTSKIKYVEANLWVSVYYKYIPSFGGGNYYKVEVIFVDPSNRVVLWFDDEPSVVSFINDLFDKDATFEKVKRRRSNTVAPIRIALELAKRNFDMNNK